MDGKSKYPVWGGPVNRTVARLQKWRFPNIDMLHFQAKSFTFDKGMMTTISFLKRIAVACGMMLAALPAAQAQGKQPMGYYDMCVQGAAMPKPFGEWDLKGNAKLPQYCKCFAPLFEARAMQANPGKAPSLEQSEKEELALRNSCRKKLDLPLAIAPKV